MPQQVRKVLVFGDVILDRLTTVRVLAPSAENPAVPVVRALKTTSSLGGAANVARNTYTLGAKNTRLYGFSDDDEVTDLVRQAGFTAKLYPPNVGHTPIKHRYVTEDGHYLMRLDQEDAHCGGFSSTGNTSWAAVYHRAYIRGEWPPITVLASYSKGCLTDTDVSGIMAVSDWLAAPTLVDPGRSANWKPFASARAIFKVNLAQLTKYLQVALPGAGVDRAGLDLRAVKELALRFRGELEYLALVITAGRDGIFVFNSDGTRGHRTPAAVVRSPDVCGAGDTVLAALAVHFAQYDDYNNMVAWDSLVESVDRAGAAAAVAVSRPGVVAVSAEDIGWT
jgi:rfaE bifunctional protein kinase chain/domain